MIRWDGTRAQNCRAVARVWSLPGKIFRASCGQLPRQEAGRLADLDQVAVWVRHVAADLRPTVDRRRQKLRAPFAPLPVAVVDVGDAQVHEDRCRVARLVVHHRDVGLVGGWRAAWIHDDSRVRELHHARVLFQDDRPFEDVTVERARSRDAPDRDERGYNDAFAWSGKIRVVDKGVTIVHALWVLSPPRGRRIARRGPR